MLTHPTHDRLIALGLTGMAKALEDQRRQPDVATLPFEERLAMIIDREAIERENKRLERRLKAASLRQRAGQFARPLPPWPCRPGRAGGPYEQLGARSPSVRRRSL